MDDKIPPNGVQLESGLCDHLFHFWDPTMVQDTSYLVVRLIIDNHRPRPTMIVQILPNQPHQHDVTLYILGPLPEFF